jgi:hypothetical protein
MIGGTSELTHDDFLDGEVVSYDPFTGVKITKYRIDDNTYALKKEYPHKHALIDANTEDRNNSIGTRWGDGQMIGRLPMHILQDENTGLMDAMRNYDDDFVRKFFRDNPALTTRDKI